MSTSSRYQLPRILPLATAARELLMIDGHEACNLARDGRIVGAFKLGNRWYVSLPKLIAGMRLAPNFEWLAELDPQAGQILAAAELPEVASRANTPCVTNPSSIDSTPPHHNPQ
jgi:hypothetical protein